MTATFEPRPPKGLLHDSWVIAKRGLLHIRRHPEALADATIQPIMFVLLFAFVFGSAIPIPGGGDYKEFLMGGIIAQTIIFSAFGVAMSLANDRKNQAIDRFQSLPLSRGAVLTGHTIAMMIKAILPIILMSLCGLVIGWRIRTDFTDAAVGYALMLGFSFAMIWVGVVLGSAVDTPEGVSGIAFVALFPLTFIASTFVPTKNMPPFIRHIAQWNPTTSLSDAVRVQFGNPRDIPTPNDPWPLHHPVAYTTIWIVLLVAICAPIGISLFQRSVRK